MKEKDGIFYINNSNEAKVILSNSLDFFEAISESRVTTPHLER